MPQCRGGGDMLDGAPRRPTSVIKGNYKRSFLEESKQALSSSPWKLMFAGFCDSLVRGDPEGPAPPPAPAPAQAPLLDRGSAEGLLSRLAGRLALPAVQPSLSSLLRSVALPVILISSSKPSPYTLTLPHPSSRSSFAPSFTTLSLTP